MAGELTYLGSVTIGDCLPTFAGIYAGVLADLQAKLAGLLELQARLTLTPPTLALNLDMAIQMVANLTASIELGLPGIDFQLTAVAALIASINVDLAVLLGISIALGTAGVYAYSYDGDVASFPSACVAAGLPEGAQPSDHMNAIVLVATVPAVWAAMGQVFLTG